MDIKPITREEMYLAKAAGQDVSLPEPITRKEMFLAKIAGMEVETPGAITRIEMFANKAAVALNRSVIEPLEITENGTYTAPEGVDGYNPVTVEVVGAGGGGSSSDVRYVTFMSYDGSEEYGKKAVAVGDDCADPIARGVFDTPTKESTAQYSYTHYGWSLEANGATDADALKAVTEDRTVYATFVSAVRYYTISYYDGETVLKSESLAYGAMPSYVPEKDGYMFDGWEPAVESVTGNTSYYAKWDEKITFAGGSWADIVRICNSGEAQKYFSIGDTRELTYTHPYNKQHTTTLKIVAFDADDLADGSGKAAMTVLALKSYSAVQYNTTLASVTWETSTLRKYLIERTLGNFPADLKSGIKSVTKKTRCYVDGTDTTGLTVTADKIWIPSVGELNGKIANASSGIYSEETMGYSISTSELDLSSANGFMGFRTLSTTVGSKNVHWSNSLNYVTYNVSQYQASIIGFCI